MTVPIVFAAVSALGVVTLLIGATVFTLKPRRLSSYFQADQPGRRRTPRRDSGLPVVSALHNPLPPPTPTSLSTVEAGRRCSTARSHLAEQVRSRSGDYIESHLTVDFEIPGLPLLHYRAAPAVAEEFAREANQRGLARVTVDEQATDEMSPLPCQALFAPIQDPHVEPPTPSR